MINVIMNTSGLCHAKISIKSWVHVQGSQRFPGIKFHDFPMIFNDSWKSSCYTHPAFCIMTDLRKRQRIKSLIILVFLIWTPQHFTYFGWTFAVKFFSGVYHPRDSQDEKVSSVLSQGELGPFQIKNTRIFILFAQAFKAFRELLGWCDSSCKSSFKYPK